MARNDVTKSQLGHYFFIEALSVKQVAKECCCDVGTIRRRLDMYGIELDPNIWYPGARDYVRKLLVYRVKLTPRQESIVVGCVLGDGYLNKSTRNAMLYFSQTVRRCNSVSWLQKELQPFTPGSVCEFTTVTVTGVMSITAYMYTVHHPEFTKFHKMFYLNGKKVVPSNIGDYLDELALAVWFMGDGHTDRVYSTLCSQSFSSSEGTLLLEVLREKFNLEGHIIPATKKANQPVLYFGKEAHYHLHAIIDSLMHDDFKYKKLKPGVTYLGVARGERNNKARWSEAQVVKMRNLAARGISCGKIAATFGTTNLVNISDIISGRTWRHVT